MIEIASIHHVAIITENALYEECKRFYTEVLGFTIVAEHYRAERSSYKLDMAIAGKYQIEMFSFPDFRERASFPESKGLRHLAFGVKDIVASHQWLVENKVRVEEIRVDAFTEKQFLFFYDPNDQPLELYQL